MGATGSCPACIFWSSWRRWRSWPPGGRCCRGRSSCSRCSWPSSWSRRGRCPPWCSRGPGWRRWSSWGRRRACPGGLLGALTCPARLGRGLLSRDPGSTGSSAGVQVLGHLLLRGLLLGPATCPDVSCSVSRVPPVHSGAFLWRPCGVPVRRLLSWSVFRACFVSHYCLPIPIVDRGRMDDLLHDLHLLSLTRDLLLLLMVV